jgi:hypothetical protein
MFLVLLSYLAFFSIALPDSTLQLALAMVFAVTHRRWAAASGADVTYDDVAVEATTVENATLGDAAVDHPDKPQEAALVRALPLDAGIGLAAVAVQTGIGSGVALWGSPFSPRPWESAR